MKYALLLNDMRFPNVENIVVVKVSNDRQELVDWYKEQEAASGWTDGRWGKHFKKNSELEWYNPANSLETTNDYWGGIWEVNDNTQVGAGLSKF